MEYSSSTQPLVPSHLIVDLHLNKANLPNYTIVELLQMSAGRDLDLFLLLKYRILL